MKVRLGMPKNPCARALGCRAARTSATIITRRLSQARAASAISGDDSQRASFRNTRDERSTVRSSLGTPSMKPTPYTGRDVYRLLVKEGGWSADEYERWLAGTLIDALVAT